MDKTKPVEQDLANSIFAMSDAEIRRFILRETKSGDLSQTIKRLNQGALSKDAGRRKRAQDAIRKLGFI